MEDKGKEISLTIFIKGNMALVNALGIFTALTIYANSLPIQLFGNSMSFLFLTISVIIWFQLWALFPKNGTLLLSLFETTISLAVLLTIFYWVLYYRQIWHQILFIPITLILTTIITSPIKKYDFYNKIFKKDNKVTKTLRYVFAMSILLICLFLARLISIPLNYILDLLIKGIK